MDVAMLDIQVSLLTIAAARFFATGEDPKRAGTEHPGRVPSAAFQCRDGKWLHISASDQHWEGICRVLSLDAFAADPELQKNAGRVARREEVSAAMTAAIAKQDREPLANALRAAGVPAGEVNSIREILNDPHIAAREMVGRFRHPVEGDFPALRTPLRIGGFDDPAIAPPPVLGADTSEVLRNMLGMNDAEIAALRAEKVI